jgi:hypothetical protein
MRIESVEERRRRLQTGRRIMVAGDQHDVQMRHAAARGGEKAVQQALAGGGGVGIVEDVAAHQQRFDVVFDQRVEQPVEKLPMLPAPVMAVQCLAEMPVRGMQQAHGGGRGAPSARRCVVKAPILSCRSGIP